MIKRVLFGSLLAVSVANAVTISPIQVLFTKTIPFDQPSVEFTLPYPGAQVIILNGVIRDSDQPSFQNSLSIMPNPSGSANEIYFGYASVAPSDPNAIYVVPYNGNPQTSTTGGTQVYLNTTMQPATEGSYTEDFIGYTISNS